MTRDEKYNAIQDRFLKADNMEKRRFLEKNTPHEADRICWHFKRLEESLDALKVGKGTRELLELDFNVSAKYIENYMDEHNWSR